MGILPIAITLGIEAIPRRKSVQIKSWFNKLLKKVLNRVTTLYDSYKTEILKINVKKIWSSFLWAVHKKIGDIADRYHTGR